MTTTVTASPAPSPDLSSAADLAPGKFVYVPGLDGLRGLGVIFMMLYHTQVAWLGDGPLFTIEMFFVLSGFLITSLFIIERESTRAIDLRRFWRRRFRRLMPALLLMFFVVMLWSWMPVSLGGPSNVELGQLRGDGLSALTYVSNWYFVFSGQSYFETFAGVSPFKHTWSLSIEEQFYLLVAIGMFVGFKRWGTTSKRWIWVCGALALASALWMALLAHFGDLVAAGEWISIGPWQFDPLDTPTWVQNFFNFNGEQDPSRMYYGTDTRLQASMVGVTMAFVMRRINFDRIPHWVVEASGSIGIGGLLLMFFLIGKQTHWIYFGGFFLADILTALAIVALMAPRRPTAALPFQMKPLVFIGGLSYSLYVWHFPIFAILDGKRILDVDDWALHTVRFALSGVVAYCSMRFFENRIRYHGLDTPWRKVAAVLLVMGFVGGLLASTSRATPSVGGFGVAPEFEASGPLSQQDCYSRPGSTDGTTPIAQCTPMVFAGDSMQHTLLLQIGIGQNDRTNGFILYPATTLGCGVVVGDSIKNGRPVRQNPGCADWPALWQAQVTRVNPSVSTMLAWGWDLYDRRIRNDDGATTDILVGTPEWDALVGDTIQRGIDILSKFGGKVALITMPCIDPSAETPQHPDPEAAEPHRVQSMNNVIRTTAAKNPATTFVLDLHGLLCPDGEHYQAKIDGQPVSDDGIHFTQEGSLIVWNWMLPQIRAAVKPS